MSRFRGAKREFVRGILIRMNSGPVHRLRQIGGLRLRVRPRRQTQLAFALGPWVRGLEVHGCHRAPLRGVGTSPCFDRPSPRNFWLALPFLAAIRCTAMKTLHALVARGGAVDGLDGGLPAPGEGRKTGARAIPDSSAVAVAARAVGRPCWRWLPWLVLAVLGPDARSAPAFPLLSSNQLQFVNLDHSPVGVCSTLTYGYTGPGPQWWQRGDCCGLGMSSAQVPYGARRYTAAAACSSHCRAAPACRPFHFSRRPQAFRPTPALSPPTMPSGP